MLSTTLTTDDSSSMMMSQQVPESNSFRQFFERQQLIEMKRKRKKQMEILKEQQKHSLQQQQQQQQQKQRSKTPTNMDSHQERSQSAQLTRSKSAKVHTNHGSSGLYAAKFMPALSASANQRGGAAAARSNQRRASNSNLFTGTFESPRRSSSASPFKKTTYPGRDEANGEARPKSSQRLVDSSEDVSMSNLGGLLSDDLSLDQTVTEMRAQKKKFIKCVLREDVDLLKALVCQNNLINIRDKHKNTLLHIACAFGRLKSAQILIKMCPALVDQVDDKGHNPCDVAIKHGQLEIVKWLLFKTNRLINDTVLSGQRGQRSARGSNRSCIHLAAKHGENEILKYVLSEMYRKNLPLDLQDLNGNTAAHLAAKYNNLECLQSLVEFNSDVTTVNRNGHTPCFVAEFYGNSQCVHYLMIVETCINLSMKVVRASGRLRESRAGNEILKAQMDEAIAINNDFINQRENILYISLDLMKRQICEMENKLFKEISRVNAENRSLVEHIQYLNGLHGKPPKASETISQASAAGNDARDLNLSPIPMRPEQQRVSMSALESELAKCKQEIAHTELNCKKIIKIDQNRLENVKVRFEEAKASIDAAAHSSNPALALSAETNFDVNNNHVPENKEHLEVLRKMYQETTHKLMIFRNALKERQVVRGLCNDQKEAGNNGSKTDRSNRTTTLSGIPHLTPSELFRSKTPTSLNTNNVFKNQHQHQISPSSSSASASNNSDNSSSNQCSPKESSPQPVQPPQPPPPPPPRTNKHLTRGGKANVIYNHMMLNDLDLIVEEEGEDTYGDEDEQHSGSTSGRSMKYTKPCNPIVAASKTKNSVYYGHGHLAKPVQSSTPTSAVHPQPVQGDFASRNGVVSKKQAVQNNFDSREANGKNSHSDDLIYSSDEDEETLSEEDFEDEEEEDDDFMKHDDEDLDENQTTEDRVYIQQDDDDDDDDDLDDQDRRMLNYTDSKNESNMNREILIKSELSGGIETPSGNSFRPSQPTPPVSQERFIKIHDNTKNQMNPILRVSGVSQPNKITITHYKLGQQQQQQQTRPASSNLMSTRHENFFTSANYNHHLQRTTTTNNARSNHVVVEEIEEINEEFKIENRDEQPCGEGNDENEQEITVDGDEVETVSSSGGRVNGKPAEAVDNLFRNVNFNRFNNKILIKNNHHRHKESRLDYV